MGDPDFGLRNLPPHSGGMEGWGQLRAAGAGVPIEPFCDDLAGPSEQPRSK